MSVQKPTFRTSILIAGDVLVILSFVWIGRSSHNLSLADVLAGLSTALPFIIGWFLITPWFGLFRAQVNKHRGQLTVRLLLAWAIAGPLALVLRALFLGRPLPGGIIPTFALVSLSYIGLVALVWRLGYSWWVHHHLKQNSDAQGV